MPYCRSESICNSAMFFLQSPSSKLHLKFLDFSSIEPSTAHGIGAILMHLTPSHTIAQGHTGSGNKQGPPWVYVEFHLSKTKSANHRQSSMANANHQWPTPIINGQRQSSMANAKLVRINLQTSTKTDQNKSANQWDFMVFTDRDFKVFTDHGKQ